jgi:hypothetical protein
MKSLIAVLALSLAFPPLALAQEKKDPTPAQKKQQARMKDCNEKAGSQKLEGEERKKFMSSCLKGEEKMTAQQGKMKACNKEAADKKLKGDDRKKFMSGCLKG